MKPWQGILLGLAMLVLYGLAGNMDVENEKAKQTRYCEMVELWNETDGDAGWPPYDGECK